MVAEILSNHIATQGQGQPGLSEPPFAHVRHEVQSAVADRWKSVTGVPISQAWGLSETSPGVCINPPFEEFNGSVGLPLP